MDKRSPSVKQFVLACANAAREAYAAKTSDAVHSPHSMRSTISVAEASDNQYTMSDGDRRRACCHVLIIRSFFSLATHLKP